MIITKQKDLEYILLSIDKDPVFIVGCSQCATLCHTGGEKEVNALIDRLKNKSIPVTGSVILDPACHYNNSKRLLKQYTQMVSNAKKIIVLSCGNGVQTVAQILTDKTIVAGLDTLFLGEISRFNEFNKQCTLCGECLLDFFNGFCPISRCPKSMLNGPCGGSVKGKCEINSEQDCIWDIIYTSLKKKDKLHLLKPIQKAKDWSQSNQIQRRS